MLTTLGIKQFKRFRSRTFSFQPMTVLTGTNGSGKTSIIHALLLIRQAALNPSLPWVQLNGSEGLLLGEAFDVLHRDAREDERIEFAVEETEYEQGQWKFFVPKQEHSLYLEIDTRPHSYHGVLAQPSSSFVYLCAEKLGPRDVLGTYSGDVENLGVGVQGEYSGQVLTTLGTKQVDGQRCCDPPDKESQRLELLHNQLEYWMHRIVRPIQIDAQWFPNTSMTQVRFKTAGVRSEWTRPPNVGFGVSYALPVVLAGLHILRGGVLIVENPEAHLHPGGQSMMGYFLAKVAGSGVQVILETHSDHVINGVRLAVAENGSTKRDKECERDRTRSYRGQSMVFWWHTKLQPHIDRIHFRYVAPELAQSRDERDGVGQIIIGFFTQHSKLPGGSIGFVSKNREKTYVVESGRTAYRTRRWSEATNGATTSMGCQIWRGDVGCGLCD